MTTERPPVCVTCPFHDACYSGLTQWNCWGGPEAPKDSPISSVHTCRACGARKLDFCGSRPEGLADDPVPEGCPRWSPTGGSALDCESCTAERNAIKQSHPMREARAAALLKIFNRGESTQGSISEFVQLAQPIHVIKATDDYSQALQLMSFFWADLEARFEDPFKDAIIKLVRYQWLEWLYLSLKRNPKDAVKVTGEFILTMLEVRWVSRRWVTTALEERAKIRAAWEVQVARVMDGGAVQQVRC